MGVLVAPMGLAVKDCNRSWTKALSFKRGGLVSTYRIHGTNPVIAANPLDAGSL